MELLCDYRTVNTFEIERKEYAMLLLYSVIGENNFTRLSVLAPSMSKAGRQLIKRLNFLSRHYRRIPHPLSSTLSVIISLSMVLLFLSNPISAASSHEFSDYTSRYIEQIGIDHNKLPESEDILTAKGFVETLFCAVRQVNLPYDSQVRFNRMVYNGASEFIKSLKDEIKEYNESLNYSFVKHLNEDEAINREQAAFLMNCFLIQLQRDSLYLEGKDYSIYVPKYLTSKEYSYICEALAGNDKNTQIFKSYYTRREYYVKNSGILTTDSQGLPNIKVELYVFDINAQSVEIKKIANIISNCINFSLTPERDISRFSANGRYYTLHTIDPALIPFSLPVNSFNYNLLGTIDDPELRDKVSSCYIYDEEKDLYRIRTDINAEKLEEAANIINTYSKYSFSLLTRDHAATGFSYLDYYLTFLNHQKITVSYMNENYNCTVYNADYFEKLLITIKDKSTRYYLMNLYSKQDFVCKYHGAENSNNVNYETGNVSLYVRDPDVSYVEINTILDMIKKATNEKDSVSLMSCTPYKPFKDIMKISPEAIDSVKSLQNAGLFYNWDKFIPDATVDFKYAAEMVVKFASALIAN